MKVRNNSDDPLVVGDQTVPPRSVGEVRSDVWVKYKHDRAEFRKAILDGLYEELLDYLDGDGDLDCTFCRGRGWIIVDKGQTRCQCVRKRDVIANVQRIWPGGFNLLDAAKLPEGSRSPLKEYTSKNLWITAHDPIFQAHLRWVAIRMGERWTARVRFDNDLLRAWFFTAKAKGVEIFDVDVSKSEISEDPSIEDLALPPQLLILVMGVKRTRNVAAWECLMEALRLRQAVNKPTWIVDQPDYRLDDGTFDHLFANPAVHQHLKSWPRVSLTGQRKSAAAATNPDDILGPPRQQNIVEESSDTPSRPGKMPSLSTLHGAKRGSTSSEDIVETERPWKPGGKKNWSKK